MTHDPAPRYLRRWMGVLLLGLLGLAGLPWRLAGQLDRGALPAPLASMPDTAVVLLLMLNPLLLVVLASGVGGKARLALAGSPDPRIIARTKRRRNSDRATWLTRS